MQTTPGPRLHFSCQVKLSLNWHFSVGAGEARILTKDHSRYPSIHLQPGGAFVCPPCAREHTTGRFYIVSHCLPGQGQSRFMIKAQLLGSWGSQIDNSDNVFHFRVPLRWQKCPIYSPECLHCIFKFQLNRKIQTLSSKCQTSTAEISHEACSGTSNPLVLSLLHVGPIIKICVIIPKKE